MTVALHAEAQPVIARFKLKQDSSFALPIFRRNDFWLAITGVGRIKSAIATSYLIANVQNWNKAVIFNIGIAGHTKKSGEGTVKIGDSFLIHKIMEQTTGKSFLPDIFIKTPFAENSLTTVDHPLKNRDTEILATGLVDMEAAGFFQAASSFLPPHRICCIKVVSDHLDIQRIEKNFVNTLIKQALEDIDLTIAAYQNFSDKKPDVLTNFDLQTIEEISCQLRLTANRKKLLVDQVRTYKLKTGGDLPVLSSFVETTVSTKQESEFYFEKLLRKLSIK
tara:strand:+ start:105349 stop:106182 length:834 start_codon:yes stop_codon:yes gene_type:complete